MEHMCKYLEQMYVESKKVLLRERKRYTARRVASDRSAVSQWGGGGGLPPSHPDLGYPHPVSIPEWGGGTPHQEG